MYPLLKHHVVKTYRGSGGVAPLIPNLCTVWRRVFSFMPWPLYWRDKSPRYPWDRRLGGSQSRPSRKGTLSFKFSFHKIGKNSKILCICYKNYPFKYMYVQLSARRLVGSSYSAGTRCARARTHTHTLYLHAHMPMHSTPHTTTVRRTKPGVEWGRVASSFPPPYCTQPGNDEVHYLTKVGSTNFIYLHHPQADNND
jgi:hypothetical protein